MNILPLKPYYYYDRNICIIYNLLIHKLWINNIQIYINIYIYIDKSEQLLEFLVNVLVFVYKTVKVDFKGTWAWRHREEMIWEAMNGKEWFFSVLEKVVLFPLALQTILGLGLGHVQIQGLGWALQSR